MTKIKSKDLPRKEFLNLIDGKVLFAAHHYTNRKLSTDHIADLKELRHYNRKEEREIYYSPNEMQGDKRGIEHAKSIRAIWVDDDIPKDKPRKKFPLKPSIIVESSEGKFQYLFS